MLESKKNKIPIKIGPREFICLMVLLMSLVALSIDTMLPALGYMAVDLKVDNPNDIQLVISTIFLGLSFGLLIFGPLSDAYGRKNILYSGMILFLFGIVISIYSENLVFMLIGRFIQGIGAASCRVISLAMVRDKYEGIELAKTISLIIAFFLFIPTIAPTFGKAILLFSNWPSIFWFLFIFIFICLIWLFVRQPETLPISSRTRFSLCKVLNGTIHVIKNPLSIGYILAGGLLYGTFIGYLNSARQILEVQYKLGDQFVFFFGMIAFSFAFSSYTNSYFVTKFKIEKICVVSLISMILISAFFNSATYFNDYKLELVYFIVFIIGYFCCLGHLFANLTSLALQPFGQNIGLATSVISATQTFLGVMVGTIIGQSYNTTVFPLLFSFFACSLLAFILFLTNKKNDI